MAPDLAEVEAVLSECSRANPRKLVVLSSAAIYGATPHNPGLISESRSRSHAGTNTIRAHWFKLEELAQQCLWHSGREVVPRPLLTILRPSATLVRDGADFFSRLFRGGVAITLPLHDPPLQLLSVEDLVNAVCCAVEKDEEGVFNVAPDGVIPLGRALRVAGSRRLPIPLTLQRFSRPFISSSGAVDPVERLEYLRYSWTVSNQKIKRELGFVPKSSSAEALTDFCRGGSNIRNGLNTSKNESSGDESFEFDDFGMDTEYIDTQSRRTLRFLHDYYFRVEVEGLEHVPRKGRAILAGAHRGFMPFDGVMLVHLIAKEVGRYLRTLIHPGLVKTPFPFNFEKLGGMNACRENADYALQRDELLSFFPEGIEGAFRYYRDAYQLGKFGRDEYVKAALRNRAPIVPFVTVGSAEIFPVLAKINWRWWKRATLWPCFPIAPPFPLLPLPLPTKWHTHFLEPLHVEESYPPEAENDRAAVRAIGRQIKRRMQEAIDDMLRCRKSIFFGSVFNES